MRMGGRLVEILGGAYLGRGGADALEVGLAGKLLKVFFLLIPGGFRPGEWASNRPSL